MTGLSSKRTDVVLIKLESEATPARVAPPFGILYLASALKRAGFSVRLIHDTGTPRAIEAAVRAVKDAQPLVVGFSVLSGPSLLPARAASRRLRKETRVPILWGGMHTTMLPGQTLNEPFIDFVAVGEGEETLVELARALAGGKKETALRDILGLGFKDGGAVQVNPARPFISDLDAYSLSWDLLPIERYFYPRRFFLSEFGSALPGGMIAPYISSRGCPWRCGYCYNQFVNKGVFRAHSAARVISDIENLKQKHGITAVVFEDDNLFTDRARALQIVRGIGLPWSASLRANYFRVWKEDFIRELRANKCQELRIGAESGVPRILDIMAKDITVEDIRLSADSCRRNGIRALYNFMVGIPGETWPEIRATFDLMDELERGGGGVVVNGPSVFFPWPGTPMFDLAVSRGFKSPRALKGWAIGWGARQKIAPYADRRVRHISYFRSLAFRKDLSRLRFAFLARLLSRIARWRWQKRFFRWPLDYAGPRILLGAARALGLKKLAGAFYEE